MKVCFETFGCRLNRAEALEEEAKFLARGWTRTESHADADLVVVRGCSVTARAQRDCERLVEHLRRKYPLKRLVVSGCMSGRTPNFVLRGPVAGEAAPVPTRTARAYLKVQDGCSGRCSFCIVPKFRGTSKSEDFDEVLDKARRFVDAGYREIVVTGCNLSLYASRGRRLPELLAALAGLTPASPGSPGRCRVRLSSLEPSPVARDVVEAIAASPNLCRFLHLPIQSGSNGILAAMRRPYLVKDLDALLGAIEERLPGCGLGCDIIAGFPGETNIDFAATSGLFRRHLFNNLHVFPYSERPDTLAAAMPDAIPREVRSQRAHDLAAFAKKRRESFAAKFVGREVEVVVEREDSIAGWTGEYLWCRAANMTPRSLRKHLVRIRVHEARGDELAGVVV